MSEVELSPEETWLVLLHRGFVTQRFYGKVALSYEAGKITTGKEERTFKPPKLNSSDKPGGG